MDKSKYLIFILNFDTKILIENCLPPIFTTNAIVEFYIELLMAWKFYLSKYRILVSNFNFKILIENFQLRKTSAVVEVYTEVLI